MKKEIEQLKEELWREFCLKMKAKLKEITDPVIENSTLCSYQDLEDVITNVILFEMNIDKEPWEQIKKRVVGLHQMKKEKNPPCGKCGKELKTRIGHTTSYWYCDCGDAMGDNVIPLINCFPHISVTDLEEIMEWLNDNEYLSEKGKEFRTKFWKVFIKRS